MDAQNARLCEQPALAITTGNRPTEGISFAATLIIDRHTSSPQRNTSSSPSPLRRIPLAARPSVLNYAIIKSLRIESIPL